MMEIYQQVFFVLRKNNKKSTLAKNEEGLSDEVERLSVKEGLAEIVLCGNR